jgi:hypothetical protein
MGKSEGREYSKARVVAGRGFAILRLCDFAKIML